MYESLYAGEGGGYEDELGAEASSNMVPVIRCSVLKRHGPKPTNIQ